MKLRSVIFLTSLVIALFSSFALAGEDCHSKDFHKNMSVDATKEFKKNHAWLYKDEQNTVNKTVTDVDENKAKENVEEQTLPEAGA
mgnify:FL=1